MLYDLTKYRFTNEFLLLNNNKATIRTDAPFLFYTSDEVKIKVDNKTIVCLIKSISNYGLSGKELVVFLPK